MAFDITKPSVTDADFGVSFGLIRENFRAIAQADAAVFAGPTLWIIAGKIGIGHTPVNGAIDLKGAVWAEHAVTDHAIRLSPGTTGGTNMIDCNYATAGGFLPLRLTANGGAYPNQMYLNTDGTIWINPVSKYNGVATAGAGIAAILASVALATQAALIGATNLIAAATGLFRVSYYHVISRAATTSSATQLAIAYNDGSAAQTVLGSSLNTNILGAFAAGAFTIPSVGGAITYATTYASVGGTTMQYGLRITIEQLQ
jgi:hypothetical protein